MSNPTKGLVYALLSAIGLLVVGLAVLVWVDSRRVRRYANEIQDLHYRLDSQEVEIRRLRKRAQQPIALPAPKADSIRPVRPADGWD